MYDAKPRFPRPFRQKQIPSNQPSPLGSLSLSATSDNVDLVPVSNIVFGGSGGNRTVTVTPTPNQLGSALITIQVSDGIFTAETAFFVTVEGTVEVMAGWDDWSSSAAPVANTTALGISASATASTATGNWSITDQSNDGRGSSGDQTWGTFAGEGVPASAVTAGSGANMTATNGVTDAQITFTLSNTGSTDWHLKSFHMDVLAFCPNAPRAYQLEVLSGDLTHGVVFASADDVITQLGGTLTGNNDDHDDVDIDLTSLSDAVLEPGESAVIQLAFSSGTGSGGGHHLFVDNVAFSGATVSLSALESWRQTHFGTTADAGMAANDFDADGDGEDNLLEFATNQNPLAGSTLARAFDLDSGRTMQYTYTRSQSALSDGLTFYVEWSDTLLPNSWSGAGVTQEVVAENNFEQSVEAVIPMSSLGRRFVRLVVTLP